MKLLTEEEFDKLNLTAYVSAGAMLFGENLFGKLTAQARLANKLAVKIKELDELDGETLSGFECENFIQAWMEEVLKEVEE